jgi:hypothetical protein
MQAWHSLQTGGVPESARLQLELPWAATLAVVSPCGACWQSAMLPASMLWSGSHNTMTTIRTRAISKVISRKNEVGL